MSLVKKQEYSFCSVKPKYKVVTVEVIVPVGEQVEWEGALGAITDLFHAEIVSDELIMNSLEEARNILYSRKVR